MRKSGAFPAGSAAVAAMLAAFAMPVAAQDTFSLPPSTASPSARPVGPVDPDNPVVRPRPTQAATPQPTSSQPSPSASTPPTVPVPQAAGTRPAPRTAATQRASAPAQTSEQGPAGDPLALPAAAPTPAATVSFPTAIPTAPSPAPTGTVPASRGIALPDWWPFAAGGLALALTLLGALLWWRKRLVPAAPAIEFEPPVVDPAPPTPLPEPDFTSPASPAAQPVPTPAQAVPEPSEAVTPVEGIALTLEARRLDASLMAATLAYTLRITNTGSVPLTALAIEADMVGAHASLPVEKQIASTELRLEPRHKVVELAPGESADLRGEMRLPLSAITPIRAGNATYFVPLARVRIAAEQGAIEQLVLAQTFVVGELPDQPGGALRPFRLDLGPRTYSRLGQRAVS
jgi:hypothetical protein